MGRKRIPSRALATFALIVLVGLLVAVPGLAQPAPDLWLAPTSGVSGSTTTVDGDGFRGTGAVSITEDGNFAGTAATRHIKFRNFADLCENERRC